MQAIVYCERCGIYQIYDPTPHPHEDRKAPIPRARSNEITVRECVFCAGSGAKCPHCVGRLWLVIDKLKANYYTPTPETHDAYLCDLHDHCVVRPKTIDRPLARMQE